MTPFLLLVCSTWVNPPLKADQAVKPKRLTSPAWHLQRFTEGTLPTEACPRQPHDMEIFQDTLGLGILIYRSRREGLHAGQPLVWAMEQELMSKPYHCHLEQEVLLQGTLLLVQAGELVRNTGVSREKECKGDPSANMAGLPRWCYSCSQYSVVTF